MLIAYFVRMARTPRPLALAAALAGIIILVAFPTRTDAAPSGGCRFTSVQWQTIVFRMCQGGRLKKRSTQSTLMNAIASKYS